MGRIISIARDAAGKKRGSFSVERLEKISESASRDWHALLYRGIPKPLKVAGATVVVAPVSWSAVGSQGQCRPQAVCGRHAVLGSIRYVGSVGYETEHDNPPKINREVRERAGACGQESPAIATFAKTSFPPPPRPHGPLPSSRAVFFIAPENRIHRRDAEDAEIASAKSF